MKTEARTETLRCAEIGKKAVETVGFNTDPDELATSIYDLIADLLHLARENGIEPDYVIEQAKMHFDAEVEEEVEAARLEEGPS